MKLTKTFFLASLLFLSFFLIDNNSNIVKAESEFSKDIKKSTEFLHPDKAFIPILKKIDGKRLEVEWDIADGYYLYLGMFKFQIDGNGVEIDKVTMPDGVKKTDEFFGNVDVYYNYTKAHIFLKDLPKNSFNLIVNYQGCADAGLCYPPTKKSFKIDIQSEGNYFYKTGFTSNQITISNTLITESVFYNVFFFYLVGILLAFTPCVFPMIPILTGLIVNQGKEISTR